MAQRAQICIRHNQRHEPRQTRRPFFLPTRIVDQILPDFHQRMGQAVPRSMPI